ncbi:MAG: DHH family phosphoesterase [Candidatus Altiarchaeota archaeon]|nr:DHH family phosphoesterase [Candidatus Altiarchaeota archaeon]
MSNILRDVVASGGNVLILSHLNADPDAVGSSIALYEYFKSKGLEARMAAVGGVNALGRNLIKKLKYTIEINPLLDGVDMVIVVDTSSLPQLRYVDLANFRGKIFAIDHHVPDEEFSKLCEIYLSEDDSTSTSEIVFRLLKKDGFDFSENVSLALITGIVTDTAHLQFARPVTLRIIAELLEKSKMEYPDVLKFISIPTEPSRKIAHLKAASRLEIQRLGEWIVGLSHVSSFEASAARALVKIGADVVFVCSKKKDEARVSIRASNTFVKKTDIHLSKDLIPEIARAIRGSGGGHVAAASINGTFKGNEKELLDLCFAILSKKLAERNIK